MKIPKPKFGIYTESQDDSQQDTRSSVDHSITVWKNPVQREAFDSTELHMGARHYMFGTEGQGQVAFWRWYKKTHMSDISLAEEDQMDYDLVDRLRHEKFEWAKKNHPDLTYDEFVEQRCNLVKVHPFGKIMGNGTTQHGHPERVPDAHFQFNAAE